MSVTTASAGAETTDRSRRRAGLIAGFALLLMAVLAAFGALFVVEGLITEGDATQTARDILGSEGLFRLAIVSLYVVVVLDVVVAWALFRLFEPVNRSLSLLAAWFRLAYAGVFLVAISHLGGAVDMLAEGTGGALELRQTLALADIDTYFDIWDAGLFLFGVHLVLVGYLAFRSDFLPRFLGVLLVVAGLGYAIDTIVGVLAPDTLIEVSTVTFVGEVLLIFWLLSWSRRAPILPK